MKTNFLFISIAEALVFVACTTKTPESAFREQVVCVKAENLVETKASIPVQATGIIFSKHIVKLSFKTGGIIARINVEEGEKVKKGQIIAELDLTEISAQVNQAKLAFDKAKRDLDRIKKLYADTVATLEQLQDVTSAYDAAMENINIAKFNQRYSKIIAPSNGKIIARLSEAHELVGPGIPVLVFSEQGADEWIVKAGVSDKDAVRLNIGDKAEISIDAYPGITFPAYVSQVAESADPVSGTFGIELTVDALNRKFINGLVAKIKIESFNSQMVTLVPPEAVIEAQGNNGYVYVVKTADSTAKKVLVTIAYLDNKSLAVLEPVNKIGPVITKGASYLEEGTKVSVSK